MQAFFLLVWSLPDILPRNDQHLRLYKYTEFLYTKMHIYAVSKKIPKFCAFLLLLFAAIGGIIDTSKGADRQWTSEKRIKKGIDKQAGMWYNKSTEKKGRLITMVVKENKILNIKFSDEEMKSAQTVNETLEWMLSMIDYEELRHIETDEVLNTDDIEIAQKVLRIMFSHSEGNWQYWNGASHFNPNFVETES